MIYILLGAAGSGKGTRAALLKEKLNIPHISIGELLRTRREQDDEIGRTIREQQDVGILVDQEIVSKVLLERLSMEDVKGGAILDGYPRSLVQAEDLEKIFEKLGITEYKAVLLEVSKEVVCDRLLNRKICPKCGKIYDKTSAEKDGNKCSECGVELITRSDDNEEAIKNRIEMFFTNIGPIAQHYIEKGKFDSIDASSNPERILNVI